MKKNLYIKISSWYLRLLMFLVCLSMGRLLQAQSLTITGKVMNEQGSLLPGVTVAIKGSTAGVTTNDKGIFTLNATNKTDVLLVSSIGYETQEVKLNNDKSITITLKKKVNELDETIIRAYGTTTRRLNTGSISKVTADEIERQPVSNPLAALEGRVPGLVVTQSSGVPGAAFKVQIRGQSSLDLNLQQNDPLFIVDGVPFSPGNTSINQINSAANYINPLKGGVQGGLSPLNNINPADIESIEVLKDADATAIYGSRGANGVIIITTKKGIAGKTQFNVNVYSGISTVTRTMDMLNTHQYLQMRYEAFKNDNIIPDVNNAPDLFVWDTSRYTDYKKLLIGGTAHTTTLQASVSGGSHNTQFLLGSGYHRQTTVFPGDMSDNKGSVHFSLTHKSSNDKFGISFSSSYFSEKNNLINTDLTNYINLPPNFLLYDAVGDPNWSERGISLTSLGFFQTTPAAELLKKYTSQTENLLSDLQLRYNIFPGMTLRANLGYNSLHENEVQISPMAAIDPQWGNLGHSYFANSQLQSWIIEPQAEYVRDFGKSKLDILIGGTWQEVDSKSTYIDAENYPNDLLLNSISAAGSITASNNTSQYRYDAVFGRINYNWQNKYILNFSTRRDASSRFGPEKQIANFGAAGVAWIFSEESFVRKTLSFLSYGKLRGSYGITGNDQIGNYQFLDTWANTFLPYDGNPGLRPTKLFNPDYSWEISRKAEVALELGFIKDRILFSLAYFKNRSSNQLVNYNLPIQSGFSTVSKNLPALVQNTGLELSFTFKPIISKYFNWESSVNVTLPSNKLISFPNLSTSSYNSNYAVGYSLNVIKGYRFLGVDPKTGIYSFQDIDKDGNISYPNDYQILGTLDPKFYGGFQNNFSFKNWQLGFFIEFRRQLGTNIYASQGGNLPGFLGLNQPVNVLNRWRKPGDIANVQQFSQTYGTAFLAAYNKFLLSNGLYSNASYIRLKNISISFSLPPSWIRKLGMKVYIQGQNLLTITNYVGADPENQNLYVLPPLKTIVAGIQFTL